MTAYYNENDRVAAHVLRCLIEDEIIAPGIVDDRSIKEVEPNDLRGFAQCHFFAGAGTWSVAARLAGWADERHIWTASCPCQPFSAAGKGDGTDDPRHLWPDVFRLIRGAKAGGFGPAVLMGEQVSGKAGYGWFDGVRADLAQEGYASRARDIPALAIDGPHQRNRLYWVAVADANSGRRAGRQEDAQRSAEQRASDKRPHVEREAVGIATSNGWQQGVARPEAARYWHQPSAAHGRNGSFWADAEWIICHDGKARRTKPDLRLLVDGMAGRIHLWRLAGNSIVAEEAAEVIRAFMEAEAMSRGHQSKATE